MTVIFVVKLKVRQVVGCFFLTFFVPVDQLGLTGYVKYS